MVRFSFRLAVAECTASSQIAEQDFSGLLEIRTNHADAEQEAPECVLFVIAGIQLVVDTLLILCEIAQSRYEFAVGIAVLRF